ncbi:hypothetical protein C5Y93_08025 [Blastopirellula marina]|uniref:DUF3969 domain-containing protein n=2 Tax=Blastopirellula marina TaxID=124 RepID=A0A2S8GQR0_9BACT|nr:hypothetical protein C5Y93_08025 [Blastopirellula marina]
MVIHNAANVIVALVCLGLIDALESGTIEVDDAEQLLFSPYMKKMLRGSAPALSEAVGLGMELDDLREIVPTEFRPTLQRIREIAQRYLANSDRAKFDRDWIERLI